MGGSKQGLTLISLYNNQVTVLLIGFTSLPIFFIRARIMASPQISRRALGLLLVLATAAAAVVSPAAADDVVALTEADFEKEVGQDRGALVEFYAPWFSPLSPLLSLSLS